MLKVYMFIIENVNKGTKKAAKKKKITSLNFLWLNYIVFFPIALR